MSEEQVCKEVIEQVGYQEFYRYFQEKTTLIEQQRKEIERLNKLISQREKKWEKWTTEKTILSTKMSDYLCKYQNIKREYTKQIKISTDRKKEIEKLNNKLSLIKGIIRTPRALDSSLAYAMVKTQIENVLGSDKE